MAADSIISFAVARAVREDTGLAQEILRRLVYRVGKLEDEHADLMLRLGLEVAVVPRMSCQDPELLIIGLLRREATFESLILDLKEELAARASHG